MAKRLGIKCEQCGKILKIDPDEMWSRQGMNTERCPRCGYVIKDVSRKVANQKGKDAHTIIDPADESMKDLHLLDVEKQGECLIVGFQISSVLDQDKAQQLDAELRRLLSGADFSALILNFAKVRFMSSMIMGRLIRLYKELTTRSKTVSVCNVNSSVREIFDIMKLDQLFELYESEEEAMAQASG